MVTTGNGLPLAVRLALPDKQQVAVFDGCYSPVLPRQFHQKTRVTFICLVQVIQRPVSQVLPDSHFQVMAGRDFPDNLPTVV